MSSSRVRKLRNRLLRIHKSDTWKGLEEWQRLAIRNLVTTAAIVRSERDTYALAASVLNALESNAPWEWMVAATGWEVEPPRRIAFGGILNSAAAMVMPMQQARLLLAQASQYQAHPNGYHNATAHVPGSRGAHASALDIALRGKPTELNLDALSMHLGYDVRTHFATAAQRRTRRDRTRRETVSALLSGYDRHRAHRDTSHDFPAVTVPAAPVPALLVDAGPLPVSESAVGMLDARTWLDAGWTSGETSFIR